MCVCVEYKRVDVYFSKMVVFFRIKIMTFMCMCVDYYFYLWHTKECFVFVWGTEYAGISRKHQTSPLVQYILMNKT